MKFIMYREKAKRIKYEACVAAEKMMDEADKLFTIYDDEKLVNTDVLGSVPQSTQSSPEKINFNH